MAALIPLLAGAGVLGLLIAAGNTREADGETPELDEQGNIKTSGAKKRQTEKRAAKAVKEKDWTEAAANALASGSKKAIVAVATAMKNEGLKKEAASLVQSFRELQEAAREGAKKSTRKKPTTKQTAKPSRRRRKKKQTTKRLPSTTTKSEEPTTTQTTTATTKKRKAVSPEKKLAREVAKMLFSSSRYKEDRALVEKYQRQEGLTADGKYGPQTAKTFYERYRIIPPNPYYWARSSDTWPYRQWLDSIEPRNSTQVSVLDNLKKTVGQ